MSVLLKLNIDIQIKYGMAYSFAEHTYQVLDYHCVSMTLQVRPGTPFVDVD